MQSAWPKKLLLLCGTSILSFLLVEAGLLLFDARLFRNSLWLYDAEMGFRGRPYAQPGGSRLNRFGFNDRDYPLGRQPGIYRILVLSDSFNWAGERTWNYLVFLRERLQSRFGDKIEVINAGYPSTHTAEQLPALRRFGMRYEPDLVVLGFFAGNDYVEANPNIVRIAYGGEFIRLGRAERSYPTLFGKPVLLRSRLLLNFKGRLLARLWGHREGMTHEQYLRIQRDRISFANPALADSFVPHLELIHSSLREMRTLVESSGSQFMIIVYPDEFQVYDSVRQEVSQVFGMKTENYQWDRAQRLVERFCREEGIQIHDLLPAFREAAAAGKSLYIPDNTHWNVAGNELAAELIEDILVPYVSQALRTGAARGR